MRGCSQTVRTLRLTAIRVFELRNQLYGVHALCEHRSLLRSGEIQGEISISSAPSLLDIFHNL
jgi:hypothetical protein